MKLSHEWIKDFVEIRLSPKKLADMLTMSGLEVEELEMVGKEANYELGITPNRADCLSVIGVAREVAAITRRKLASTRVRPPKGRGRIADVLKVVVKNPSRCPRYAARVIKGVTIGRSPGWMVKRLAAIGIRSINNVVDATNYVMIERGQPLHAFDARLVQGGRIVVRVAGDDANFRTLDGVNRPLAADDLMICDAREPVALAGVMGGENSEVSDRTTDLILESAYFSPSGIRRTSKRLGLMTESSRRFERGVDPNGVDDALHRLTDIIVQIAGGTPTADFIDIYPRPIKPLSVALPVAEVERVLGIAVPVPTIRRVLTGLGFGVAGATPRLKVSVPTYRTDVTRDVDIIEEVARIYGYDRIPETRPHAAVSRLSTPRAYEQIDAATQVLIDVGFSEALIPAFESLDALSHFAGDAEATPPVIANPLSTQDSIMRTELMPGLLTAVKLNMNRQRKDIRLFALQRVYRKPVGTARALEPLKLAGLLTGKRNPASWQSNRALVDFYDAKGAVEAVLVRMGLAAQVLFQRGGDYGFLVPGGYATVLCANKRVGWVGQLHPQTLHHWDIEETVFGFELNFDAMAALARQLKPRFRELSRFPFVERDLSIVVDAAVPHVEIERTISQSLNTLITNIRLFDVYQGKGVPEGKKSMTYSIRYASDERTLTDEEVNEAHARVVKALEEMLGAVLR